MHATKPQKAANHHRAVLWLFMPFPFLSDLDYQLHIVMCLCHMHRMYMRTPITDNKHPYGSQRFESHLTPCVVDFINDPPIANTNTMQIYLPCELLAPMWPRVIA